MNDKKKLLITGAGGMLGADLMAAAAQGGFVVQGADINASGSLLRCDITDAASLEKTVRAAKPDIIINCAAYTDVDGAEKDEEAAYSVNRDGVRNIVASANEAGAKVIHIGTDFSFDGKSARPYTEDDEPNPLGVYAKSKVAGETEARKARHGWLIVRSAWLYGGNGKNFVTTILRLAKEKPELRVVSDQAGSPTYTKDLAGAILGLIEAGAEGIVHAANEGIVSWHGFAEEIIRNAGLKIPVRAITTAELGRPAPRPAFSALDTSKYKRLTGRAMRPWRTALKDFQKNS